MSAYRSQIERPAWLDKYPLDWKSRSGNLRRVNGVFQRKRNGVWVDIPDAWVGQVPEGSNRHHGQPVKRRTRKTKKKVKR